MKHGRNDYDARIQDSAGLIPDDEPVFLIRAQDKLSGEMVRLYANLLIYGGGSPAEIDRVQQHAALIEAWHVKKQPSAPDPAAVYDDGDPEPARLAAEGPAVAGKPVRLVDLVEGQTVVIDDGFTCMEPGLKTVRLDADRPHPRGFYLDCSHGAHYLDGQEINAEGTLAGVTQP